jgi:hypothetical protein
VTSIVKVLYEFDSLETISVVDSSTFSELDITSTISSLTIVDVISNESVEDSVSEE